MEKVIVSKEVAEGIEHLRYDGETDEEIVRVIAARDDYWIHSKCDALNREPLDVVIKALYIGYEIEETPNSVIQKYYRRGISELESPSTFESSFIARGRVEAVVKVLDTLGIKIEGVNA